MGFKEYRIAVCSCRGQREVDKDRDGIIGFLREKSVPHVLIDDLCGAAATDAESIRRLFNTETETLLIACGGRPVSLALGFAGVTAEILKNIRILDRYSGDGESLRREILDFVAKTDNDVVDNMVDNVRIESESGWKSWYPLVDYSRCSGCGQCAQFCLFGVYEQTADGVRVVNPQGCKDQCPACARLCPEAAIVFPKYTGGGAIGGSEIIDEAAEKERILRDTGEIAGNDIYRTLKERKAKRAAIIKEKTMQKALREREKALAEENGR